MRILKLIIVFAFLTVSANACDLCNCYLGLDPGFNKNTIGLRSNFRYSSLEMPATGAFKVMHTEHEDETGSGGGKLEGTFIGMELFAKIFPVPKLMVIANLPYQFNSLSFNGVTESTGALSDMTLMGLYQLANTMSIDSNAVRHRLFGGLGAKLPTGKSSGFSDIDIPMSHELNPGTGSTDYLVIVSYLGKYKRLGWNAEANFKYNTESKNDYQYGHTLNITPRVFFETGIKSVKIFPHIGSAYELGLHDKYSGEELEETGGNTFWGSGGMDFYYGKFSIATDVRIPVAQHLHGKMLEDKFWLFGALNFHF